jgi:hypothetical protein
MASSANFLTNQSLPFYPKGNVTGAILTLSQARARVRSTLPFHAAARAACR